MIVNSKMEYYTRSTKLPPYLPFPRFLLRTELSLTARIIYSMLMSRTELSRKNGWYDDLGRVYVIYTIESLANDIDKSPMTIKKSLSDLEIAGLIERKRMGMNMPNHIYVKLPTDEFLSIGETENSPSDGQKTKPGRDRKLSTNHKKKNQNNNYMNGFMDYTCEKGESL